jgi:hypothetical protein
MERYHVLPFVGLLERPTSHWGPQPTSYIDGFVSMVLTPSLLDWNLYPTFKNQEISSKNQAFWLFMRNQTLHLCFYRLEMGSRVPCRQERGFPFSLIPKTPC